MNPRVAAVASALVFASTTACGASESTESTITVYAAASLTDSFTEIAEQFETANPGVTVRLNFAGSSDLVAQIQQGAPADVFASADTTNMDRAKADGLVQGRPVDFATNVLQIATPPDNPAGVESLGDLTDPRTAVVLCAPHVPCGAAAVAVEQAAGLDIEPVSEEQSVTDVLNKISTGEADAGLVYLTDVVRAGGDVLGIDFTESASVVNTYPIASISADARAAEFVAFVTGADGQSVLRDAGFGAP